jgi:hypothetical protein
LSVQCVAAVYLQVSNERENESTISEGRGIRAGFYGPPFIHTREIEISRNYVQDKYGAEDL